MYKTKKGFTLVELIVVITILAILGTISFLSFQGYTKDARDAKRISDTRNLIGKINIEQAKGIALKKLIIDTEPVGITINGKNAISNIGIANFEILKENELNFKDPLNENQDYSLAYSNGTVEDINYNFIEVATISEKENIARVLGNYYKILPLDSPSLFKVGENFIEDGKSDPLPYNPGKNEGEGGGKTCKETTSNEGYLLTKTDNGKMVIPTPKIDLIPIENGTKSTTQNYKCKKGKFVLVGEEIVNLNCKDGYVESSGRCVYEIQKVQDPNIVGDLELVNEPLGNEESYFLDTKTGLKWQVKGDTKINWSVNNSYPEPLWNGNDYEYKGNIASDYPAFQYCRSLGARWRIPTLKELMSIGNYNKQNSHDGYTNHPNITTLLYWTSQQDVALDTNGYVINFFDTDIHSYPKEDINALLCVHDDGEIGNGIKWIDNNIEASSGRLVEIQNLNGTGALKDTFTNLNWQRDIAPGFYRWAINNTYGPPTWDGNSYTYSSGRSASDYPIFKYCGDLGPGWRVPTKTELLSIATFSYKNQNDVFSIHPNILSTNTVYRSSDEYKHKKIRAWAFNYYNLGTVFGYGVGKLAANDAICVHN